MTPTRGNIHQADGVSLRRKFWAIRSELTTAFGKPTGRPDRGKSTAEYEIVTPHGVVDVYDWRADWPADWNGRPRRGEPRCWHVAATSYAAADHVLSTLGVDPGPALCRGFFTAGGGRCNAVLVEPDVSDHCPDCEQAFKAAARRRKHREATRSAGRDHCGTPVCPDCEWLGGAR